MLSRFTVPKAAFPLISSLNHSPKLHYHHLTNLNPFLLPLTKHYHLMGPTFSRRTILLFSTSSGNATPADGEEGKTGKTSPATVNGEDLPAGLRRELMPRHVALILDGNKRWAERRGLECEAGHEAGLKSLFRVMGLCARWRIQVATFFLFSSENWTRPKEEIDFVMWRCEKMLVEQLEDIKRAGIQISTIGDTSMLPKSLQEALENIKEATKDNTKTQVIFAVSYSGKNDIIQACQSLATKVRNGELEAKDITDAIIEQELETKITTTPRPDLLIRTSGEVRISNFMLWQLAYSELYFTNTLWPDFGETEFLEALLSFQNRGRRFGGRS